MNEKLLSYGIFYSLVKASLKEGEKAKGLYIMFIIIIIINYYYYYLRKHKKIESI